MISETFVESCFHLLLTKNLPPQKENVVFRDIQNILAFLEKQKNIEIPISMENKFRCLQNLSFMRANGKSVANSIDSITSSEKYKDLKAYLNKISSVELSSQEINDYIQQILMKKKIINIFSNFDDLNFLTESLNEGTFESLDDIILKYEKTIKKLYRNLSNQNRTELIENSSSLNFEKDDFTWVLNKTLSKYDSLSTTPSGFQILDDYVFNHGGFEPSRLYIIAGMPGSGKSTFLNNLIVKSATLNWGNPEKKKVYVYVTMENTIEEALLRTYQALYLKKTRDVIEEIKNGVDIKKRFQEKLEVNNAVIIMKYFRPDSVTPTDLSSLIQDIKMEYGDDSIVGLYVDYLDLLTIDFHEDLYRLKLGYITMELKTVAVEHNIPLIVPTQLGRGSYKIKDANSLTLDLVTESVKKVEHSDTIMLLGRDPFDNNKVLMSIGKNRSGVSNVKLEFDVDFTRFNFKNGRKLSMEDSKKRKNDLKSFDEFNSISSAPNSFSAI